MLLTEHDVVLRIEVAPVPPISNNTDGNSCCNTDSEPFFIHL